MMSRMVVAGTALCAAIAMAGVAYAQPVPRAASPLMAQVKNQSAPGACAVRVIVPVDRGDPSIMISAAVEASMHLRGVLRPQTLGSPRIEDAGDRMIFTFDRPAASCGQMFRLSPVVTCTARATPATASNTHSYAFPSASGFSNLAEVIIPRSC